MAGTKEGGRKAAATNKARHGNNFYVELGRKGGQNGHTGGFFANPELAKEAGRKAPAARPRLHHHSRTQARMRREDEPSAPNEYRSGITHQRS